MSKSEQYHAIVNEMVAHRNKSRSTLSAQYFKTGKGDYAEGDIFLGLTVPQVRTIVKLYRDKVSLSDVTLLLRDKYHELRLAALLLMVARYERSNDAATHKAIFLVYTKHAKYINNWDLVDTSAPQIVGAYISDHMEHEERLAFINAYIRSHDLWKNRIIVLATFYQIRKGNEKMAFYVARELMQHKHDLIHKSIGWMLREVGKRDRDILSGFLDKYAGVMPRTMLRYALEHYPSAERNKFMMLRKRS